MGRGGGSLKRDKGNRNVGIENESRGVPVRNSSEQNPSSL